MVKFKTLAPFLLSFLAPLLLAGEDQPIVEIVVLGIAQDAGYPQVNCYRPHCMRAWKDPILKRHTASLAIVDHHQKMKYLVEATPDIRNQLYGLQTLAPDHGFPLRGVFLTHGHMGHYTGLMHFGREAAGTSSIPVFAMPRMANFLAHNGPWSQLVDLKNIKIQPLEANDPVLLSKKLRVTPFLVPHRDEYTETVGFRIQGPNKSALFIPDIDKWEKWDTDLREIIQNVDYALIDGSFFSAGELPGRDMSEIPHPSVHESMSFLAPLPKKEKSKVYFIHFNHTNPLLIEGSEAQREVEARGFRFAVEGLRLNL